MINGAEFFCEGVTARVAVTIKVNGQTQAVRSLETEKAYRNDSRVVKSTVERSRFIPGMIDERVVPMGYVAVLNYPIEQGEAFSTR